MTTRHAVLALVITALLGACGGDDEGGGISLDEPIGTADSAPTAIETSDPAEPARATSVIKEALVELEVVSDELDSAAQEVVDVATGPEVGGFLVSSVVDTSDGPGFGNVVVRVPSPRFEQVVTDINGIGEVTRQQLLGDDVAPDYLAAQTSAHEARGRVADLLDRLEEAGGNAGLEFRLREQLETARAELAQHEDSSEAIQSQASFSSIEVALAGTAPAAPPQKPVFERALATAKKIVLAIASGAVLAGGVLIPIGLLLLVVYRVAGPLIRRLRPRMQS